MKNEKIRSLIEEAKLLSKNVEPLEEYIQEECENDFGFPIEVKPKKLKFIRLVSEMGIETGYNLEFPDELIKLIVVDGIVKKSNFTYRNDGYNVPYREGSYWDCERFWLNLYKDKMSEYDIEELLECDDILGIELVYEDGSEKYYSVPYDRLVKGDGGNAFQKVEIKNYRDNGHVDSYNMVRIVIEEPNNYSS